MSLQLQSSTFYPPIKPDSIIPSPKRKRDITMDDPTDFPFAPSPTRLRTSHLPTSSAVLDDDVNGDRSPRATVAGHFQNLNLTGDRSDSAQPVQRLRPARTIADSQDSDLDSSQDSIQTSGSQPATPQFRDVSAALPLEIPETPRLKPTTVLSPVPSPIPRSHSSPSLNLWWADAEITGHDPKDPTDDGEGINGVGFIPTPAMASARAERRKKQVAEWKSREAREARQRRSEARRRRDLEMPNGGVGTSEGPLGGEQQRRVRFLEV
ncbi:MAG: hypothetical protein L6R42_007659 [Xanthoria sp. 1 TBL-2021]|nr:MAG: hypothetical protein L6R42_007659 [Xanthoria sp. 1 TBL-2021]